jgi:rod shape determining protein RodA
VNSHSLSDYLSVFKPTTRARWDLLTPFAIAGLGAFGVAFIYSAQLQAHGSSWLMQLVWLAVGAGIYAAVSLIDYRIWLSVANWCYLAALILLVLVLIPGVGSDRFGARRWIDLGFFSLQPSESAKIAVLLITASLLVSSKMGTMGEALRTLGKLALAAGVPILLILGQPDLKSVIVLPPMVFAMLYVSRFPARLCAWALGVFLFAVVVVVGDASRYAHFMVAGPDGDGQRPYSFTQNLGVYESHALVPLMHDYQRNRLVPFLPAFLLPTVRAADGTMQKLELDPLGEDWNREQSLISVSSGGLAGKGWTRGTQAQLGYLPRAVSHNDFIFSVIAEELGFLGSFTVLSLFGLVMFNGVRIAGLARDRFGTLLALGVTVLFAVHVFVNIAMTIGLVPITGIPLPFVSYGGSFVLSCCLLQGLVQSVYRFRKDFP